MRVIENPLSLHDVQRRHFTSFKALQHIYDHNKTKWRYHVTGMVLGSYFWGCLADTKGRKVVLVSTLLIDGFIGIVSSFVQILPVFMVCRFVNGFS